MPEGKFDQGWEKWLKVLATVAQVLLLPLASWAVSEIKEMNRSINQLNVQVAVLLTNSSNQKDEIREIQKRVSDLERAK